MRRVLTTELIIYIVIFVALSMLMHQDLFLSFSDRFNTVLDRKNYFHPFVYTFLVYIFILILRFFIKNVASLLNKFRNK